MNNHYYYEVVRIKNGCILYLNEHLDRLINSVLEGAGKKLEPKRIKNVVEAFITENGIREQNFKITIDALSYEINIAYIDSVYPPTYVYQHGVLAKTLEFNRQNPHVKQSSDVLFNIRKRIEEERVHDFLLVSSDGLITEGTKTNIFFIKNKTLIVPNRKHALLGITMQCVLKSAKKVMPIIERNVALTELDQIDAAFFTGTSIGMLPIRQIDDILINTVESDSFINLSLQYDLDEREYCAIEGNLYAD